MFVPMKVISLFSGIGGFELAADAVGWDVLASCEINPFGRRVLEYYWPESYLHDDVHTLTYEKLNHELTKRFGPEWRSDDIVLVGGFPCQPYSLAGKRKGKDDSRHLWPEMLRIIREIQPTWVVGENVYGLVNWNEGLVFEEVSADLENEGYEVQPYILPAVSIGAVHRRDRVWFVAHRNDASYTNSIGCDNGSDNRKERHIQGNERIAKKNKSERNGWECGVGKACSAQTESFANTDSNGCDQRNSQHEVFSDERGFDALNDSNENDGQGFTPNPDNDGLEGEASIRIQTGQRRRNRVCDGEFAWVGGKEYWDNFPTQSPVRCGDDGIPDRMVDITIPRWRKEALMALGNAVVPQVVIALFNSINEYNKTTSSS
jgi:DNA (cytosine-5)-methyltransferase 1